MKKPRIAWVLGWAIPENWFRSMAVAALPERDFEHIFVEPSPDTWANLERHAPFDWLVGYSLGSLILLQNPGRTAALAGKVALLAPIWAFTAEADRGGKIPRANLKVLANAYRKSPRAALSSFYKTAGLGKVPLADLTIGEPVNEPKLANVTILDRPAPRLKSAADIHPWGLEQLDQVELSPGMPENWLAWIGENDPLLNAARTQALVPIVQILPGVTHAPAELIAAFAASLE